MKHAIVILGMHRSGTSSVAGALVTLGATPPRTLMPEHPDNPKGYWESAHLVELSDSILESAGSSWSDWRKFNPKWAESSVGKKLTKELSNSLAAEFGEAPLITLKDPRMCRNFPLWINALKTSGFSPLVLTPVRSPLEVAASLTSRDKFSQARGFLIWLRHVLDAEFSSRGLRRHFVLWSSFMDDWRTEVSRAEKALGFVLPARSDFTDNNVDQFLDVSLRRHSTEEKLATHTPEWISSTYDALNTLTKDPNDSHALSCLDRIRDAFDATSEIYGPAFVGVETERFAFEAQYEARVTKLTDETLAATETAERERQLALIAQSESETARAEQANLRRDIEAAIEQIAHIEGLRAATETSRSETEINLIAVLEDRSRLQSEIAASNAIAENVKALEDQLIDYKSKNEKLKSQNQNLERTLLSESTKLKTTIQTLEAQLSQSLADAAHKEITADDLQKAALVDRQHIGELEHRLSQMEAQLSQSIADAAHKEITAGDLQKAALVDRQHIGELEHRLSQMEAQLSQSLADAAHKEITADDLQKAALVDRQHIGELEHRLSQMEADAEATRQRHKSHPLQSAFAILSTSSRKTQG